MEDLSLTFERPGDLPVTWTPGKKILLINPPVVDLRVPWADWVEPTGLLKLGTYLQQAGRSVRLLDAFTSAPKQRERDAVLSHEGQTLWRWRYGLRAPQLRRQFRAIADEGWIPDDIIITTLTSFWWRGVPFIEAIAREAFPSARIVLGGAYPKAAPRHAAKHARADVLVAGPLPDNVLKCVPAYELYSERRMVAAISNLALTGVDGALKAVEAATAKGVTRLHLADQAIAATQRDLLTDFLEQLAKVHLRTRLFVLGAINAADVAAWPELPVLLRAARCRQISLADNRDYPVGVAGDDAFIAQVSAATPLIHAAGFRPRTNDYAVGLSIGKPGEAPSATTRLLAHLAHVAGSIVPIPYQPNLPEVVDPASGGWCILRST